MGQYLEEIWEASGFEVCCLFSAALGADTLNPVLGGNDGHICCGATRDSGGEVWEFRRGEKKIQLCSVKVSFCAECVYAMSRRLVGVYPTRF